MFLDWCRGLLRSVAAAGTQAKTLAAAAAVPKACREPSAGSEVESFQCWFAVLLFRRFSFQPAAAACFTSVPGVVRSLTID